jgi:predicted amidohydrolase
MLISLYQMQPLSGDVPGNIGKIAQAAMAAAEMGAELLVTPELGTSGYALGAAFETVAEGRDGSIIGALTEIAADCGLAICAGFPEREGNQVFNSSVLVRPDGTMEFYRKSHLYGDGERAAFVPGSQPPHIFDLNGIKTGMLICYDVEFPENVRTLALAGAELVLVPTALPQGIISRRIADTVVPTRAFENSVFLVYADLCGEENGLSYGGRSVILAPDGDELARAGMRETLLVAEIDTKAYDDAKAQNPYLIDRRPGLYRLG